MGQKGQEFAWLGICDCDTFLATCW